MLLGLLRDAEFFSVPKVQAYVESCWLLRGNVNVERRGSVYLFHFTVEEDLDDVIIRSPLNINDMKIFSGHVTIVVGHKPVPRSYPNP
ncbi:hypothetical protein LIER_23338 [Lithospermum erythrorhizon]|uniref:Uncharacterized protein n=1 Tax=Lithospermum erythrorhizon TaxID=34254 RepID=A0AAV3R069_LITER